jgi:hypothetical protein
MRIFDLEAHIKSINSEREIVEISQLKFSMLPTSELKRS